MPIKLIKLFLKIFIFCLLTIVTQVGGIIYILVEISIKKNQSKYRLKKLGFFITTYLIATFLVVPNIAPLFGREKIKDSSELKAHNFLTKLMNRDYVKPQLITTLKDIANSIQKSNPGIAVVYLDANFPFIDGFPLIPHHSHNDGKKIDISFIYKDQNHKITNKKPTISGYGVFENPLKTEYHQTEKCKQIGYWQYDITKYVTFGTINNGLKFSKKATKDLLLSIVNHKQISTIFIEPHLKNRLKILSNKIRFHGCRAVRHDDHIHIQL
ncbi:hypothetical protein [Aquimarina aquimarini]|uniref:hypothetical protein n=1 Tax=Aquimarina aquimarini TaxID=1191734 RepID=UPI000D55771A|nr:hypothetical protein [Aquimarina aquimarini]